jgi:hypothetical protein
MDGLAGLAGLGWVGGLDWMDWMAWMAWVAWVAWRGCRLQATGYRLDRTGAGLGAAARAGRGGCVCMSSSVAGVCARHAVPNGDLQSLQSVCGCRLDVCRRWRWRGLLDR